MVKGGASDQNSWVQIPAPLLTAGPKLCCLASWRVFLLFVTWGTYLTVAVGFKWGRA